MSTDPAALRKMAEAARDTIEAAAAARGTLVQYGAAKYHDCYLAELAEAKANGALSAAASPTAILALLDELDALRAAHQQNARLLGLVIHDLVGRVEGGKLAALEQCRERAALSGGTP
jgi:hypothetical protein